MLYRCKTEVMKWSLEDVKSNFAGRYGNEGGRDQLISKAGLRELSMWDNGIYYPFTYRANVNTLTNHVLWMEKDYVLDFSNSKRQLPIENGYLARRAFRREGTSNSAPYPTSRNKRKNKIRKERGTRAYVDIDHVLMIRGCVRSIRQQIPGW